MNLRYTPPDGPDDPKAYHHVWRYYLTRPTGEWMGTVFLDDRGQLTIHSVYGPASFDWEDAATDPRVTFAAQSEDDDDMIIEHLSRWHPATRRTVVAITRNLFPLFRAALRAELQNEREADNAPYPRRG